MEYDGDGHYSFWDVKASVDRGASMIAQTIYRSATLTALRSGRSCLVGQPFETHQQKLGVHQHVPHPMSHQARPRRVWESIQILVIPRDQIDTPITAALLLRVIAKNAVWPVRTRSQPLRKKPSAPCRALGASNRIGQNPCRSKPKGNWQAWDAPDWDVASKATETLWLVQGAGNVLHKVAHSAAATVQTSNDRGWDVYRLLNPFVQTSQGILRCSSIWWNWKEAIGQQARHLRASPGPCKWFDAPSLAQRQVQTMRAR